MRPRNGSSSPIPYLTAPSLADMPYSVTIAPATFLAYAFATRGRAVLGAWRQGVGRMLVSGGVLGIGSFGAFLWALSTAPVAGVAALRETSVIFAALIGAVVLGERATPVRHLAAALVAAGVVAMAVGR